MVAGSTNSSKATIQGGTDSEYKDQKKLSLPKRTTPTAYTQTFGGIEDFFLLREGKADSLKSTTSGLCTPPSKTELYHSVFVKFRKIS